VMMDARDAIFNAITEVLSIYAADASLHILNCFFHVMQNVRASKNKGKLRVLQLPEIRVDVRRMHKTSSSAEFAYLSRATLHKWRASGEKRDQNGN
jgi:hypothetical protein